MVSDARKMSVRRYLGKNVTVEFSATEGLSRGNEAAPSGSVYRGYFFRDGDRENSVTAYVLSETPPESRFTGRVIGILHGRRYSGDALIIAPPGPLLHQGEIAVALASVCGTRRMSIESLYQRSCGVILYRRGPRRMEYLVLHQAASGIWSFPKGHMEAGETEEAAARRETLEEAGIHVGEFLSDYRREMRYRMSGVIEKTVILFAAPTRAVPVLRRRREIDSFRFVPLWKAKRLLHPDYGPILDELDAKLKSK